MFAFPRFVSSMGLQTKPGAPYVVWGGGVLSGGGGGLVLFCCCSSRCLSVHLWKKQSLVPCVLFWQGGDVVLGGAGCCSGGGGCSGRGGGGLFWGRTLSWLPHRCSQILTPKPHDPSIEKPKAPKNLWKPQRPKDRRELMEPFVQHEPIRTAGAALLEDS